MTSLLPNISCAYTTYKGEPCFRFDIYQGFLKEKSQKAFAKPYGSLGLLHSGLYVYGDISFWITGYRDSDYADSDKADSYPGFWELVTAEYHKKYALD